MHGAKELGLSLRDYYASAETVVEGQMRLLDKFGSRLRLPLLLRCNRGRSLGRRDDIFRRRPAAMRARLLIRRPEDIDTLSAPDIGASPMLQRVLQTIAGLKARLAGQIPIIGRASPSLRSHCQ